MKNKEQKDWYKLDNAAKLYPAIIGKTDSGVFRIGVNLKKTVIPSILQQAVIDLKPRFPSMYVKLKPGLFWYYFEKNEKTPIIKEEVPYINQLVDLSKNNDYYFTVFHYNNRISLECFHSLCDGAGATEFLKAITFHYFELLNYKMNDENIVLTIHQKFKEEEIEDSFEKNFSFDVSKYQNVKEAYHIRDIHFPKYYDIAIINGKVKTDELLSLARKNNATITQYLAALLTYSIYESYKEDILINKERPINILIPVNMRKFFESKTLRNFSLFFYTSINCNMEDLTFVSILNEIKKQFASEINKERFQYNLNKNVAIERNILMKICPLFIKNFLLKIASNIFGNSLSTITLSNMGNVDIPDSMREYIKDFDFNLSGNFSKTNNLAVISCNGSTTISFSRTIYETKIEKVFFNFLVNEGLSIEIESNLLESYL